jgi:uncharacterized protein YqfA (UPF0365 family)
MTDLTDVPLWIRDYPAGVGIYRTGLAAGRERAIEVARLAVAYDSAIQACANNPDAMTSHCTAEGDTLDDLYEAWIAAARALLSDQKAP